MKINSYIFKTANKNNTIIFYKYGKKSNCQYLKKRGIQLIKANLIKDKYFLIKLILKKRSCLGCRNLLVEGGNDLSSIF